MTSQAGAGGRVPQGSALGQVSQSASAVAFEQAKADILALSEDERFQVVRDPMKSVRIMLTGFANAQRYLPEVQQLPFILQDRIATAERNALALGYTQSLVNFEKETPKLDPALVEEVKRSKKVLVAEFELCVARGVVEKEAVRLHSTTSNLELVEDVKSLALFLLSNWATVGSHIGGNQGPIEEALVGADQLLAALSASNELVERTRLAYVLRSGAWTLSVRSYYEWDRALSLLRYHQKDVRTILPSPFATKKRKPGTKNEDEPDEPADTDGEAASPNGGANRPGGSDPPTDPTPPAKPDPNPGANLPNAPVKPSKPFE